MIRSVIWENYALQIRTGPEHRKHRLNIYYALSEGTPDQNTVTRWLVKFHTSCKNVDDQTRSARHKTVDSEDVIQATEASLVSTTQRVSIGLAYHSLVWLAIFTTLANASEAEELCLTLEKYCKTFDSL